MIIVAPEHMNEVPPPTLSIFLAGGITGCADWQDDVARRLDSKHFGGVYNPRREDYGVHPGRKIVEEQIQWEWHFLRHVDAILFWFCGGKDTPNQPISLLELGRWIATEKPLFIGAARDYSRRLDVEIQVGLERPQQTIHETLSGAVEEATRWSYTKRYG